MSEILGILYSPQLVKNVYLKKEEEKDDSYRELVELEKNFYFENSWVGIEEVINHLRKAGAEQIKMNSESSFTANLNGSALIIFLENYAKPKNSIHQPLLQIIREISPDAVYQLLYSETWTEPLLKDD